MPNDWMVGLRPSEGSRSLVPCSAPATVAVAEAELGHAPVLWATEVAARATDKVLEQITGLDRLRAPREQLRAVCESCVLTVLRGLRQDLPATRIMVPIEQMTGVRDLVRLEIPLDRLVRMMWTSHVQTYEALLEALEQTVEQDQWASTTRRVTDLTFAYLDALTESATSEYEAERQRWLGSVVAVRRRMIDEILAGHPVHATQAEDVLGVRLRHQHCAVVLWAVDDNTTQSPTALDRLRRVATSMAQTLSAPNLLMVPGDESALWAWLSWKEAPPHDAVALMNEVLPPDLRAAVGSLGHGREGFRRSHLRAREAENLARAGAEGHVFDYAELSVVSLLSARREQARWFVEDHLGALAGTDPKAAELRETLRLYLAFGRSRTAAAQRLHVAPTTVAYRVKRAEEVLGRELGDDELDLRLALELTGRLPDEFIAGAD